MIESIEGRRGTPRLRPPYVAQVGLFGRPTLVNNPETLYWASVILEKGAPWYCAHGRRGRTGLRSFSVSGRVRDPGVKLAPAGISLRELIDEYCGGMAAGHVLYAYLPGGAVVRSMQHLVFWMVAAAVLLIAGGMALRLPGLAGPAVRLPVSAALAQQQVLLLGYGALVLDHAFTPRLQDAAPCP